MISIFSLIFTLNVLMFWGLSAYKIVSEAFLSEYAFVAFSLETFADSMLASSILHIPVAGVVSVDFYHHMYGAVLHDSLCVCSLSKHLRICVSVVAIHKKTCALPQQ
jgi:glycogen synthase